MLNHYIPCKTEEFDILDGTSCSHKSGYMIVLWLQDVFVFHSIIFHPKSILVKNNLMSYLLDVIFDFL
jgi:hypothetical protein